MDSQENFISQPAIPQKPSKSKIWIVGTIWANIFIVGLILAVGLIILNVLMSLIFGSSWAAFTGSLIWTILFFLIIIGVFIYSIKLGVKAVLKKSAVRKEDILLISFGVAIIPIIFQIGIIIFTHFPGTSVLLQFIAVDIVYFVVTYWFLRNS